MGLLNLMAALVIVALVLYLVNYSIRPKGETRAMLNIVLGLILAGMFLWLINTYVPMAQSIKAILNIVVVIGACVKVLQAIGAWTEIMRLWNSFTSHRGAQ